MSDLETLQMITVGYNYYNNRELFEQVKHIWSQYPDIKIVWCDDGSQDEPLTAEDMLPSWELYRIEEDLPFAYNLARNTIMRNIDGWALLLDLDHIPNATLAKKLGSKTFEKRLKREHLNLIHRIKYPTGEYKQHTSQFFVHSKDFWLCGGYDESVTGYGNDHKFRTRFNVCMGSDYRELPDQYKLFEIAAYASPEEVHEKRKTIRDVPNPGYTVRRLA